MKKSTLFLTVAIGLLMAVTTSRLLAADAASKEVTITGNAVCAKCVLHESDKCQTVIQAQVAGKTVNFYVAQNDVDRKSVV